MVVGLRHLSDKNVDLSMFSIKRESFVNLPKGKCIC
jgi:hypothetical protein